MNARMNEGNRMNCGVPCRGGNRRRGERGLSLAEVIVAAALALIGFLVALILYQAARDLFKRGEQASDQQQAVRLGFDQMIRDLRLAGFNSNPDGSKARLDEQIEGAWAGAVMIRGDFDNEDSALSVDPEPLIKGPFNLVSTGNDEIVGFVLRKQNASGGASLTMNADVHSTTTASSTRYGTVAVRDNVVDAVAIDNVYDSTQNTPPYILYRVSLNNSDTAWGGASFVQFTPVSDNIKSLTFKYYDGNGTEIPPPGGTDSATAVADRFKISRVDVTLVGMTPNPDLKYTDTTDSLAASQHYRKFSLTSSITPRNLGKFGVPDLDLTPPSTPSGLATCAGHCNGMRMSWTANPAADLVAQYTVRYGTTSGSLTATAQSTTNSIFISGLSNTTYYFQVRAEDLSSNVSAWSSQVSALVRDDTSPTLTTPVPVDSVAATASGYGGTGGLPNKIDLSWTPVTLNNETLTCDPGPGGTATVCRDLAGYRIYRTTSSSATSGTLIASENGTCGAAPCGIAGSTATSYSDIGAVNCRYYYYFINAIDKCSHESTPNWSPSKQGMASTSDLPDAPVNVTAARIGANAGRITFPEVTSNDVDATISIDTYEVWRTLIPTNGSDPFSSTYTQIATVNDSTIDGTVSYDDTAAPAVGGDIAYYKVRAKDECPNFSPYSDPPVAMSCPFSGTVSISPPSGASIALGARNITVSYSGTSTLVNCNLTITKVGGSQDKNQTIVGAGPSYAFSWTPGQGVGTYTAVGTITNASGCTGSVSATYTVVTAPVCALIVTPNSSCIGSGGKCEEIDVAITNSGGTAVDITQMVVRVRLDENTCNPAGAPKLEKIILGSTTLFDAGASGVPLPTTATLSSAIRVNASSTVTVRFDFAPDANTVQDKCNTDSLGNITRRDSFNGDLIFNEVGVFGGGTCAIASFNNGAPVP